MAAVRLPAILEPGLEASAAAVPEVDPAVAAFVLGLERVQGGPGLGVPDAPGPAAGGRRSMAPGCVVGGESVGGVAGSAPG